MQSPLLSFLVPTHVVMWRAALLKAVFVINNLLMLQKSIRCSPFSFRTPREKLPTQFSPSFLLPTFALKSPAIISKVLFVSWSFILCRLWYSLSLSSGLNLVNCPVGTYTFIIVMESTGHLPYLTPTAGLRVRVRV